jgi:DNA-binding beta-propeller fold protein YncE
MRPLLAFLIPLLLTAAPKTVATIAGNGTAGFSETEINNPYGLTTGHDGALYICEIGNHVIRRLDLKTHKLTIVAGNGKKGFAGQGGPATEATLNEPYEVRFDKAGNMFFVDMQNHSLLRVDAKTKILTAVAGNGSAGFTGDGGPAAKAQFKQPHSLAFGPDGAILVCDIGNNRIRRIDMKTGTIDTYAGNGERKPTPDGAPLAGTPINEPRALDLDPQGNLYLATRGGNTVYRIDAKAGKIYHLAGTGQSGYTGDGGPAKEAKLSGPKGISWSRDGGVYIADTESHTIRRIDLKSGIISTVVGTGQRGDGPEGDPLQCKLARPHGIFVARNGLVYVGDSESHRILLLK